MILARLGFDWDKKYLGSIDNRSHHCSLRVHIWQLISIRISDWQRECTTRAYRKMVPWIPLQTLEWNPFWRPSQLLLVYYFLKIQTCFVIFVICLQNAMGIMQFVSRGSKDFLWSKSSWDIRFILTFWYTFEFRHFINLYLKFKAKYYFYFY